MREQLDELARLQEAAMAEQTTIAICAYRRALLRDGDALLEYVRWLEGERDEASQLLRAVAAIINPHDPYDQSKVLGWARDTVERAREADVALAHAAELRGALEYVSLYLIGHPHAYGEASSALNRTPEQSLAKLQVETLVSAMRKVCAVAVQTEERESRTFSWSEAASLIHDEADRLEKEATDGR